MYVIIMTHMRMQVFLWVLYDFANSLVYIPFFLYFSQWVVIDRGLPDLWLNICFAGASLLLLAIAPFLGTRLDRTWSHIPGLRYTTGAAIVCYGMTAWAAVAGHDVLALVFFTAGFCAYSLSFVFYTPLLAIIARSDRRGRVSAYGMAGNFTGNIAALLITLPFATGAVNLFGGTPRAETLAPAVFAFALCALPVLLFFKVRDDRADSIAVSGPLIPAESSRDAPPLRPATVRNFFIAFALSNGAIVTTINNYPIFLQKIWGVPDTTKMAILVGVTMASAVGSLIAGQSADRYGNRKIFVITLACWVVAVPVSALIGYFPLYVLSVLAIGALIGSTMTVSRALMADLVGKRARNTSFAYYTMIERASGLVGPFVWGLTVPYAFFGLSGYRVALLVMTLFIASGLLLFQVMNKNIPAQS